jgi:hypothetical protein
MPLMWALVIAPTSFILSSIFSINESGISKNEDLVVLMAVEIGMVLMMGWHYTIP